MGTPRPPRDPRKAVPLGDRRIDRSPLTFVAGRTPLQSRRVTNLRTQADRFGALLAGVLLVCLVIGGTSLLTDFEHDPDEGNSMIKARLFSEGYGLYSEIWCDHPPLFTYALVGWERVFGWSMESARMLSLLLAACLVALTYRLAQQRWGHVAACLAVVLLTTSARFFRLSVSVMIGLPSITLTMAGFLALLHWRRHRRVPWLVLSALALAAALATKLWVAFLGPLLFVWILWEDRKDNPIARRSWLEPLLWLGVQWAVALLVLWSAAGSALFDQLIRPHVAGYEEISQRGFEMVPQLMRWDWHLHMLALLGLFQLFRHWPASALLRGSALWYLAGLSVLFFHAPVWYHHSLLVTPPAAILGGAGVVLAWRKAPPQAWPAKWLRVPMGWGAYAAKPLSLLLPALLALWIVQGKRAFASWRTLYDATDFRIVELLKQDAGNGWVVDARPLHAFRAGLLVPPELAVTSRKRFASGLDASAIAEVVDRVRPSWVILSERWPDEVVLDLDQRIAADYRLVYQDDLGNAAYRKLDESTSRQFGN